MMAQPFLQFGTVALDPVPNCRVVHFQAALAEQFFDIACFRHQVLVKRA